MAPIIQALKKEPGVDSKVCVTAQHRQMLDQVFDLFQITPDVDLNLMKPNQSLAALTAAIFTHLDPVLADIRPDWVLAQGDTTTVMATALLAYYHRIGFGHVEAGLRTYNKWHPFPEEVNRLVAGAAADLHFAPTTWARDNLLRENIPGDRIFVTGNPVIDALYQIKDKPLNLETQALIHRLGLDENKRLILVTAHRRENFGTPLKNICRALLRIAAYFGESVRILFPVHFNPNVRKTVFPLLEDQPGIVLTDPLDYLPMVQMMKRATILLTDSGGLQEEGPGLSVPVLVMRKFTERPEGIDAGIVKLVGTDGKNIFNEVKTLLEDSDRYAKMKRAVNPYGDGKAAERIIEALKMSEDEK